MVRIAVVLMASVTVPPVSLVLIASMSAPMEGSANIVTISVTVTLGTAPNAILGLVPAFVGLVSKVPDVTRLVSCAKKLCG